MNFYWIAVLVCLIVVTTEAKKKKSHHIGKRGCPKQIFFGGYFHGKENKDPNINDGFENAQPTARDCQLACKESKKCLFWEWRPKENNACWFKGKDVQISEMVDVDMDESVSGHKCAAFSEGCGNLGAGLCASEKGLIRGVKKATLEECDGRCRGHRWCNNFLHRNRSDLTKLPSNPHPDQCELYSVCDFDKSPIPQTVYHRDKCEKCEPNTVYSLPPSPPLVTGDWRGCQAECKKLALICNYWVFRKEKKTCAMAKSKWLSRKSKGSTSGARDCIAPTEKEEEEEEEEEKEEEVLEKEKCESNTLYSVNTFSGEPPSPPFDAADWRDCQAQCKTEPLICNYWVFQKKGKTCTMAESKGLKPPVISEGSTSGARDCIGPTEKEEEEEEEEDEDIAPPLPTGPTEKEEEKEEEDIAPPLPTGPTEKEEEKEEEEDEDITPPFPTPT